MSSAHRWRTRNESWDVSHALSLASWYPWVVLWDLFSWLKVIPSRLLWCIRWEISLGWALPAFSTGRGHKSKACSLPSGNAPPIQRNFRGNNALMFTDVLNRLAATGAYLFFMALTMFLAFYPNEIPLRLMWLVFSIFLQFLALMWYSLTYIPFANQIIVSMLKRLCCNCSIFDERSSSRVSSAVPRIMTSWSLLCA